MHKYMYILMYTHHVHVVWVEIRKLHILIVSRVGFLGRHFN